jgi:hypothetical protein
LLVDEWSFGPKQLQLAAGQPVTLTLDNTGKLEHDVSIPALGVKLNAAAGKTATQTFTPTREGTFDFLCSIAGHKEAGMVGKVQVSAGSAAATSLSAPAVAAPKISAHTAHDAVATTSTRGNQLLAYTLDGDTKVFDLNAQHVTWEVLPGEFVDAYAYNGMVPGPVIRATEGENVRINFTNQLPEATVIHFHGPRIPNSMDGVAAVTQKSLSLARRSPTSSWRSPTARSCTTRTTIRRSRRKRDSTASSSSIPKSLPSSMTAKSSRS